MKVEEKHIAINERLIFLNEEIIKLEKMCANEITDNSITPYLKIILIFIIYASSLIFNENIFGYNVLEGNGFESESYGITALNFSASIYLVLSVIVFSYPFNHHKWYINFLRKLTIIRMKKDKTYRGLEIENLRIRKKIQKELDVLSDEIEKLSDERDKIYKTLKRDELEKVVIEKIIMGEIPYSGASYLSSLRLKKEDRVELKRLQNKSVRNLNK